MEGTEETRRGTEKNVGERSQFGPGLGTRQVRRDGRWHKNVSFFGRSHFGAGGSGQVGLRELGGIGLMAGPNGAEWEVEERSQFPGSGLGCGGWEGEKTSWVS